ncbi:MAG: MFS transporter [Clostridiales Family XIII bacterium]|nr:MFS transporter [Clostridiales Family XIII bacterium]
MDETEQNTIDTKPDKSWIRNTALFMFGQAVSLIGSSLVGYAIMWYVTLKTESGTVMTLFTVATSLPMFFVAPFGGVWADRYNRKYIINLADASIAIVTLIIAVFFSFGIESLSILLICSMMRSLGQGVQMPAVSAIIPQIVPEKHLLRVNSINSSIQSISMLASPALAGALLSFAPIQIVLFIDVTTAIIGISIVFFFVKVPKVKRAETQESGAQGYFQDIAKGLRYIRTHAFIMRFFIFSALFYIMFTPSAMLTPLQVTRDFGPAYWRLTAIEIVFSCGMILGGIVLSLWGGFRNKTITFAFGTFLFGSTAIGLGLLTNFWFYLVCMGAMGITVAFINTPVMSILQAHVEEAYMGRVFSVNTMIMSVAFPAAMLAFGPLSDKIPIDYLLIGTGIGIACISVLSIVDKTIRDAGKL